MFDWLIHLLIGCGEQLSHLEDIPFGIALFLFLVGFGLICLRRIPVVGYALALAGGVGLTLQDKLVYPLVCFSVLAFIIPLHQHSRDEPRASSRKIISCLLLLAIILFAAILRLWRLHEYPQGIAGHSVQHFWLSSRMAEQLPKAFSGDTIAAHDLYYAVTVQREGPFAFVNALGLKLIGGEPSQLQVQQVLLGLITVFFAFLVGRSLLGNVGGTVLAALVATDPWQLAYARYSDAEHVVAPLQFYFSLYFLIEAWRDNKPRHWLLAGLGLGLCWYVYATNQLLPVAYLAALIIQFVLRPEEVKDRIKGLTLFAFAFLFISLPQFAAQYNGSFISIFRQPHALTEGNLYSMGVIDALWGVYRTLFLEVDEEWYKSIWGGIPPGQAVLLGLGFAILLRHVFQKRDGVSLLLVFLVLVSIIPCLLGPGFPFRRLMLCGLSAELLTTLALIGLGSSLAGGRVGAIAITLPLLIIMNVFTYFHLVSVPEADGHVRHTRIAEQAVALSDRAVILFLDARPDECRETMRYVEFYDAFSQYPPRQKPSFACINPQHLDQYLETSQETRPHMIAWYPPAFPLEQFQVPTQKLRDFSGAVEIKESFILDRNGEKVVAYVMIPGATRK